MARFGKIIFSVMALLGAYYWAHTSGKIDLDRHGQLVGDLDALSSEEVKAKRYEPLAQPMPRRLTSDRDLASESLSQKKLSEGERKSIDTYLRLLASQDSHSTQKILSVLQQAKLYPVIARDRTKSAGSLAIVRTNEALPGTRYFHAQVFEGEGGQHLQHASFEIRPGADSLETAVAMLRQTYPGLGKPEIQQSDYVLWRASGRVISAKKMTAEDLKHNYYNAHAKSDVGTVWVVNEDDPEDAG